MQSECDRSACANFCKATSWIETRSDARLSDAQNVILTESAGASKEELLQSKMVDAFQARCLRVRPSVHNDLCVEAREESGFDQETDILEVL